MTPIKNILVPYDFSSYAQHALSYGIDMARATGAALHVLHIELLYGTSLEDAAEGSARAEALRKKMEADTVLGDDTVQDVIVYYAVGQDVAAAPSILEYAAEHQVGLIIAGTHGRRGLRRAFLGSVAEEIVRMSTCPVLTLHGPVSSAFGGIRRILAPVDFSDHARVALRYAAELASLTGARLDILHVIHEPQRPVLYDAGIISLYAFKADIEEKVLKEMEDLFASLNVAVDEVRYHVARGYTADEISQFAKQEADGLIVMGTHGLTGWSHLLLGSVTEKVVRIASVPVFTIRTPSSELNAKNTKAANAALTG